MTENQIQADIQEQSPSIGQRLKSCGSCSFYIILMLCFLGVLAYSGLGVASSLGIDLSELPLGALLGAGLGIGILVWIGSWILGILTDKPKKDAPPSPDGGQDEPE